jgi:hypothetical protein
MVGRGLTRMTRPEESDFKRFFRLPNNDAHWPFQRGIPLRFPKYCKILLLTAPIFQCIFWLK